MVNAEAYNAELANSFGCIFGLLRHDEGKTVFFTVRITWRFQDVETRLIEDNSGKVSERFWKP